VRQARLLFDWDMEHERGIDAQERLRLIYDRPAVEGEWAAQRRLIAVLLWRAAHDRDVLVDEVELSTLPSYYAPARARLLLDGPVPAAGRETVQGLPSSPDLLQHVAAILSRHAVLDLKRPHRVGPLTTVGYRIREIRATPGWSEGDWTVAAALARRSRRTAWEMSSTGRWRVSPVDLQAAAQACPATDPVYDYPCVPVGRDGHRLWLQEAYWLVTFGAALGAVADTLPRTAAGSIGPLAMVLSEHAGACRLLRESVDEIEAAWAAEPENPTDLSYWDLSHVPVPLVEQSIETGALIGELHTWLDALTEEHT